MPGTGVCALGRSDRDGFPSADIGVESRGMPLSVISALDPLSMMKVEDLIDELKRTVSILLVTHNLPQAARCADRVAFFYLGEVIESGSAEQMFTAPKLPQTRRYVTGRFG
jgi:ABC-type phosphate transport system ATPase subunit